MNRAGFEEEFARNFAERGDLGASVSVWKQGREVICLAGGFRDRDRQEVWTAETPVLIWSATKGPSAACLLHSCQEGGIPLNRRVADFWPEFAQAGKDRVTIGHLLSHQAGLPALSQPVSVLDHDAVAAALAAEAPQWPLGEGHGYHPRTFGFLVDELLRRITSGTTLGRYWRTVFGDPLDLQLWIGLPRDLVDQVAPIFPARNAPPKGDPFYTAFLTSGSLTSRAFASPKGLHSVGSLNTTEARAASFPAFGGIGTASALAKFYALLAGDGFWEGQRFFQRESLDQMTTTLSQGPDHVLLINTAFSAGFMKDPVSGGQKTRVAFGPSFRAFGHPGAGGSHGFADPENQIAFAYVMNQMAPGVLPGSRSLRLVDAVYAE